MFNTIGLAIGRLVVAGIAFPSGGFCAPPAIPSTPIFGIGEASCATWLGDQLAKAAGDEWALGYWTGLNTALAGQVGRNSDPAGVLGEIEKICREQPSVRLWSAIVDAYSKMRNAHR